MAKAQIKRTGVVKYNMPSAKPCPFCGGLRNELTMVKLDISDDCPAYQVNCENCLAGGPIQDFEHWALKKWNKRSL